VPHWDTKRQRAPADPAVLAARDAAKLAQRRVTTYPPRTAHNQSDEWLAIRLHGPADGAVGRGPNRQAAIDALDALAERPSDGGQSNVYGSMDWFAHDSVETPDNPVTGSTFAAGAAYQNDPSRARTEDGEAQTDTPAFKRWFGDSAVVDAAGVPLRVYHGSLRWTKDKDDGETIEFGDVRSFDRHFTRKALGRAKTVDQVGSWFSDQPGEKGAGQYVGSQGVMYPVYLSLQNPWRPREGFKTLRRMAAKLSGEDPDTVRGPLDAEPLRQWLEDGNYDGIIFPKGTVDGSDQTVYVAFNPSQIKSAIGNSGAFDPGSPDIAETGNSEAPTAGLANPRNVRSALLPRVDAENDLDMTANPTNVIKTVGLGRRSVKICRNGGGFVGLAYRAGERSEADDIRSATIGGATRRATAWVDQFDTPNTNETTMKKTEAKTSDAAKILLLGDFLVSPYGAVTHDRMTKLLRINGLSGTAFPDIYAALQALTKDDLQAVWDDALSRGMEDPDAEDEEEKEDPERSAAPGALPPADDYTMGPTATPGVVAGALPATEGRRVALARAGRAKTEKALAAVSTHEHRNRKAKVYKDREYDEFCVKFYVGGDHLKNADYFTDDKADAESTAKHWVGLAGKDAYSGEKGFKAAATEARRLAENVHDGWLHCDGSAKAVAQEHKLSCVDLKDGGVKVDISNATVPALQALLAVSGPKTERGHLFTVYDRETRKIIKAGATPEDLEGIENSVDANVGYVSYKAGEHRDGATLEAATEGVLGNDGPYDVEIPMGWSRDMSRAARNYLVAADEGEDEETAFRAATATLNRNGTDYLRKFFLSAGAMMPAPGKAEGYDYKSAEVEVRVKDIVSKQPAPFPHAQWNTGWYAGQSLNLNIADEHGNELKPDDLDEWNDQYDARLQPADLENALEAMVQTLADGGVRAEIDWDSHTIVPLDYSGAGDDGGVDDGEELDEDMGGGAYDVAVPQAWAPGMKKAAEDYLVAVDTGSDEEEAFQAAVADLSSDAAEIVNQYLLRVGAKMERKVRTEASAEYAGLDVSGSPWSDLVQSVSRFDSADHARAFAEAQSTKTSKLVALSDGTTHVAAFAEDEAELRKAGFKPVPAAG
jgi:hypothetical protein